jgi:hypothetical protein
LLVAIELSFQIIDTSNCAQILPDSIFVRTLTTANTLVQGSTLEALRGRVMSLWTLTAFGLTPFGSLQAGALASALDAPLALGFGALVCLAAAAVALLTPGLGDV